MKKLFLKFSVILSILMGTAMMSPTFAFAAAPPGPLDAACKNAPQSAICKQNAAQEGDPTSNPVAKIIARATRIIAVVIGLAAVIMIIYSGLSMILSGDNAESMTKARGRIKNSIFGLIIAALAYTITSFAVSHIA